MLPDALTSVLRGNLVGRRAEWEAVVEEEVTLSPGVENNDPGHLGRPHSAQTFTWPPNSLCSLLVCQKLAESIP